MKRLAGQDIDQLKTKLENEFKDLFSDSSNFLFCNVNVNDINKIYVLVGINQASITKQFNNIMGNLIELTGTLYINDYNEKIDQSVEFIADKLGYKFVNSQIKNNQIVFTLEKKRKV